MFFKVLKMHFETVINSVYLNHTSYTYYTLTHLYSLVEVSTEAVVGQERWVRHDDCGYVHQTPYLISPIQTDVDTVDSGLHTVQTMEGSWAGAFVVVTEVHSVHPGVCMGTGKGAVLLDMGFEERKVTFVGMCKAVGL